MFSQWFLELSIILDLPSVWTHWILEKQHLIHLKWIILRHFSLVAILVQMRIFRGSIEHMNTTPKTHCKLNLTNRNYNTRKLIYDKTHANSLRWLLTSDDHSCATTNINCKQKNAIFIPIQSNKTLKSWLSREWGIREAHKKDKKISPKCCGRATLCSRDHREGSCPHRPVPPWAHPTQDQNVSVICAPCQHSWGKTNFFISKTYLINATPPFYLQRMNKI